MINCQNEVNGNLLFDNPFLKLSKRELELYKHLIQGVYIKKIGRIMNIEQSTATTLKKRMFTKLGVSNMIELTQLSIEYGYI